MHEPIGTRTAGWAERIVLSLRLGANRQERDRGEPLDVATRSHLEPLLGFDLSQVRLHEGERAAKAAGRLGARAFAFQGHVFGSRRELDATKAPGLGLLAHELTHVIQQTQPARVPGGGVDTVGERSTRAEKGLVLFASTSSRQSDSGEREAQAEMNEQTILEAAQKKPPSPPAINTEEIASLVYRLMQHDLVLGRERSAKLGGQRW